MNIHFSDCNCFKQLSYSSKELSLTLMFLTEWVIVRLHGKDITQFLHNQLTCDIKNLNKYKYIFGAHCNSMGKIISNMYIFYINFQEIAFIERINVCEKQIKEMRKYSIFSDVTIIPDYKTTLIGISGHNSRKYLNNFFSKLPNKEHNISYNNNIIILYFHIPIERFLLIFPYSNKEQLNYFFQNKYSFPIQCSNNNQWTALDIESGYPWIELQTSELFIPQSINMDKLNGINFNKGCYIGQETIARIQYRGKNKQKLYQFIGIPHIYKLISCPSPGNYLELKVSQNTYKRIGIIIQCCYMINNNIWIQAVLNKSIQKNSQLRVINSNTQTNIHFELIYSECISP